MGEKSENSEKCEMSEKGKMKKATIIIPNYNGLKFMEMCMSALEKQTCKDFEILVVDNGSTDGSVEWLKENEIPSIFLPGEYRIFRCGQCGNQGVKDSVCDSVKQRYRGERGIC